MIVAGAATFNPLGSALQTSIHIHTHTRTVTNTTPIIRSNCGNSLELAGLLCSENTRWGASATAPKRHEAA